MTAEIIQLSNCPRMTPEEYKAAIPAAGFKNQGAFADYLGVNIRTVNDWGSTARRTTGKGGKEVPLGPPVHIERLLKALITIEQIRLSGSPEIDKAPAKATTKDAVTAVSSSISAIMGVATLQGWSPIVVAEAIEKVGKIYKDAAAQNIGLDSALNEYAKSA